MQMVGAVSEGECCACVTVVLGATRSGGKYISP